MSAAIVEAIEQLKSEVKALKKAGRMPERMAYRPREVAALTGLRYEVVLELIHAGELQAITVGRLHVVPHASVLAFLARTGDTVQLGE
ncbi:helix-turn-helix domain-containing protein [Actinophytocola sp.]|uniref:helix-turn-helix domain-containing protein n=1 Tax=Actinophytocola sp. TaxID=1872138 RepID=UPI002D65961B|nr:helix-turn-helix domain-containing protein [Actinophytocola sp.]HYQ69665.1 helix-turn-helix domain-containing protein [Actinophytocola sp.]